MDQVLAEAKRYLPETDYVVDLYDYHFVWAGPKLQRLTGYSEKELQALRNLDLLDSKTYSDQEKRRLMSERIAKEHDTQELVCCAKDGTRHKVQMEHHAFKLEDGWYLAGCLKQVSEPL